MRSQLYSPRPGFTLVQLLVVVAILLVIMSISLVVGDRVWTKVMDFRTRREISQLADGCEAFKLRHGTYPPSRIWLNETGGYEDYRESEPFRERKWTWIGPTYEQYPGRIASKQELEQILTSNYTARAVAENGMTGMEMAWLTRSPFN